MVEQEKAVGNAAQEQHAAAVDRRSVRPTVAWAEINDDEWAALVQLVRWAALGGDAGERSPEFICVDVASLSAVTALLSQGSWSQSVTVGATWSELLRFMGAVSTLAGHEGDEAVMVNACSVVSKLAVELDRATSRDEVRS
jgi:hypothetical protein